MEKETNNPTVEEPAEIQEPTSEGLDKAEETTVEGTGTVEEQPAKDSETGKEDQVKGVDLNKAIAKLTPAEQKAYKAFQADYTKKSQSLSEHEKKVADYETYYKNMMADPEYAAIAKSKQAKAEAEKEPDFSKMNDEEIFNYTVDKRVKAITAELEKKMDGKYGTYIQSKLVSEGNKLISDFAEEKKLPVEDVRELAKYAVEHKVGLDEAYKVAYFDKIPEAAKQEALEDLDLKKKANLELGSIPSGVAPIMPKLPTVREALEAAKRTTGIKLKE